jgi:hypothetical protein
MGRGATLDWGGCGAAARHSKRVDEGSGREWGKRTGVEEQALPVGPNRCASPKTGASEPHTRTDVPVKALSFFFRRNVYFFGT